VLINLGYIHRDIKPENTLVKGNLYKVSDFGFSCKADINCIKKLDMVCGTPLYMAPQLL
jgi:calcium-dependent protein kinase